MHVTSFDTHGHMEQHVSLHNVKKIKPQNRIYLMMLTMKENIDL